MRRPLSPIGVGLLGFEQLRTGGLVSSERAVAGANHLWFSLLHEQARMRQFLFQSTVASVVAVPVDPLTFNAHIIEIGSTRFGQSSTQAKRGK